MVLEICPVLLRIPETVHDSGCNDRVLHALVHFRSELFGDALISL